MGRVAIRYKIMCDPDADADADAIAAAMESLESDVGVVQMVETKPLAFGIRFVEAHCVIDEGDGTLGAIEDEIRAISGGGEIEVLQIGLI